MKIYKSKDRILQAVLAEIHKSAQKPDKGFMTVEQWGKRWGFAHVQTSRLIRVALKAGIMIQRNYRVITCGRQRIMKHYGESLPSKKSKSLTKSKR